MHKLAEKRLFLLDMDGTLYIDDTLFPGVSEFLSSIREKGGRYLFLTNNSSRGIDAYLEKMARLGIPARPEDFLTSVDVTIDTLRAEYPSHRAYVLGTRSLFDQLKAAGLNVTCRMEEEPDLLLCGFDTELRYQKLVDACILLGRGVPYLATNPDWVCPTSFGYEPDCGSICEMLWHATGCHPRFLGKPKPDMVFSALRRTGFAPEEAVLIGDRLYTDIACGYNAGIDTVFVLSGEGVETDIEKYGIQPSWIFPSVRELLPYIQA